MPRTAIEMEHRTGFDALHLALDELLARGSDELSRLAYAASTVAFVGREEGARVCVALDRRPPEVLAPDAPADITITLSDEQAAAMAEGRLALPYAIARGDVETDGPARRYAEVDPILRGALREQAGGDAETERSARLPSTGESRLAALDSTLLAIETRGLHKSFGRNSILRGVDLRIPEGVISVILGPSGTGKSVMLNHIIGLMTPDQGDVLVRGRPLSGMSSRELLELRLEVGVMYQDGALFSTMNIFDNVAFPLRQHTDLTDREVRDTVIDQLEQVGLGSALDRMPGELSGGMRKRAGLARALVRDPGILICDEPDSGLDPVRTTLLGELLVAQHERMGGTTVVITHNMGLVRTVAEHISVLWQGEILISGMADDIFASDDPFVRQFVTGSTAGPLGME